MSSSLSIVEFELVLILATSLLISIRVPLSQRYILRDVLILAFLCIVSC